MKIYEVIKEAMPDKQTLAKLKQDAQQLKAMSKTGDVDPNKTIPIMQNMANQAAAMDMGGMVLKFFQTFTAAIKKGIDDGSYGPNELPQMQKAYDEMMAQMPALQKMANDSKKLAVKYGGAGRQDVGETASGMGASSVATVVGNVGGRPQSRNMYNADGTMKNGLEYGNLLGGKKKSKKKKQA
jgi:hypothetical protein